MVVLNFYGKIEPICISEKLGLYIANLPSEEHNEWRGALANELELTVKADKIYQEKIKKDPSLKLPTLESYPDYQESLKEKEYICERKDLSSLYENDTGNHTFVERL